VLVAREVIWRLLGETDLFRKEKKSRLHRRVGSYCSLHTIQESDGNGDRDILLYPFTHSAPILHHRAAGIKH
jgi:hypothetical protein